MGTSAAASASSDAAQAIHNILARFVRYHPDRIDLSLDRMHRLLSDLGNPHTSLPPVIHVAGTNGKGSTIAFLRAALEASGRTVSSYTSPHLIRFAERYCLAGVTPEDSHLLALFEEVEQINAGKPITEFEITTAAGLLAMSRTPADIAILEVGLGGQFDATNVIDKPLATVITRIAMDHMEFLGDTISAIAREKAGILKAGVPAIIGPQDPEAMHVIAAVSEANGARLYRAGMEWTFTPDDDGGVYQCADTNWRLPAPVLPGDHQRDNAATAAACLDICDLPDINQQAVATGLRTAAWPGRLQRIESGRLVGILPESWELWIDAAHNPSGAEAAARLFQERNMMDPKPLHLVLAMATDKDSAGLLSAFSNLAESITVVPVEDAPRMRARQELADEAQNMGFLGRIADSIPHALTHLTANPGAARVLITGSHLLVGAALSSDLPSRLDQ